MSVPRSKRGKRAGSKANPASASGDEKDARIRELEARIAELEARGENANSTTAAVVAEPKPAEETLRESEPRHTDALDVSARPVAEFGAIPEVQRRELRDAKQRLEYGVLALFSRELRNPLAPIKNSLHILGRASAGGDQASRAQAIIETQVDELARLIDGLLDLTRIARSELKLQCERLELNQLVRQAIADQRSLFERAAVFLELHAAPRPVFVNADRNRLAQVMGNLLQNAAKFTSRGGATLVTVHAEKAEKRAVIQVVDTGVGIAPEMVSRLFQPFHPADSSVDHGGLGLGLALAKGLVELHGGDVAALSAGLGQGAEFTVRLPLADDRDMGES